MNKDLISSKAITHDTLPDAQSRAEHYLDYLCGRATDLAALPEPLSRVEHFLEYLCHNGGIGGGNVQPLDPRTIINAELDDNTLIFTQLDGTKIRIPLDPRAIINAELVDKVLIFTQLDGTDIRIPLDNFARLDEDNLFLGHNMFNEVSLIGKTPFAQTSSGEATQSGHNTGIYCGYRAVSTHHDNPLQGTRFVSAVKIKVINSYAIGDKIDGVNVVEIKKVNDRTDDIVGDTIVSNGTFIVEHDTEYGKCIYVPVQKEYTQDTYFIIGKQGNRALSECRYTHKPVIDECVNNLRIDALPPKDAALNHNTGNGWIIIHSLVTNDINVRDTFEELRHLISLLQSRDTATYFVANKAEFEQLKQTTTFNSGDVVYIIDSTGVEDYTSTDVNNNGRAVSLIYDENVNGFRLFSKDSEKINLKAGLVAVEPPIDGINNAQGVMELFNRKFVSNLSYDVTNRALNQTKGGQESEVMNGLVTTWGHLDYTTEYKIDNIFIKDTIIDGECYHNNGVIVYDSDWCRVNIPCTPGETISIAKKAHDSQVVTYLNASGGRIDGANINYRNVNGWVHYIVTVPNNNDITQISVNIYKPRNPLDNDSVMIYRGNKVPSVDYCPPNNGRLVILDGDRVELTFDPTGTNLTSVKAHEAIKELDKKIANINVGGGTVTSVNGHQGTVTLTGADIDANVNGSNTTIQEHLAAIKNDLNTAGNSIRANHIKANNNETEILKLKKKHPVYNIGDIVTTVYNAKNSYIVDEFEFLYLGVNQQLLNRSTYGDLLNALGVSSTTSSIYAPYIADTNLTYDLNKTAKRRHYICARRVR